MFGGRCELVRHVHDAFVRQNYPLAISFLGHICERSERENDPVTRTAVLRFEVQMVAALLDWHAQLFFYDVAVAVLSHTRTEVGISRKRSMVSVCRTSLYAERTRGKRKG